MSRGNDGDSGERRAGGKAEIGLAEEKSSRSSCANDNLRPMSNTENIYEITNLVVLLKRSDFRFLYLKDERTAWGH